ISRATALQSIAEDSGPVTFAACGSIALLRHPAMISAADRMNIFSKLSLFYLGIVKRYPFYRQEMRVFY
ncbi:hypothetical protein, partial [Salmonella enterica]|uniref:hypothetical protein n=1 Tax=Salmonella enterica TaxID=28901 RepID=UPI001CA7249A